MSLTYEDLVRAKEALLGKRQIPVSPQMILSSKENFKLLMHLAKYYKPKTQFVRRVKNSQNKKHSYRKTFTSVATQIINEQTLSVYGIFICPTKPMGTIQGEQND